MDEKHKELQRLLTRPSESMGVEIKSWFDPSSPEGIAKIARTCIALYNNDGGHFVIGLDDKTGGPDSDNAPTDLRSAFHPDKIQEIISKYASEPFGVDVEFVERDGQTYPMICVPAGVRTPMATKAELRHKGQDGKERRLIEKDVVYVRTVHSNGRVSTSRATHRDWRRIVDTCMENREADIGRFVRRHLGPQELQRLRVLLRQEPEGSDGIKDPSKHDLRFLQEGRKRFETLRTKDLPNLPDHGSWEVSFSISGSLPKYSADRVFLLKFLLSNPHLTGWPPWVDSRGFHDESSAPYTYEGLWEALIAPDARTDSDRDITFWRVHPSGRFYHYRTLPDDVSRGQYSPKPLTELDFRLVIWRISEAMAVAVSFSKALEADPLSSSLHFSARWDLLEGRVLSSWSDPSRYLHDHSVCRQQTVTSQIQLPLDVALSALHERVRELTNPLFEAFQGASFEPKVVEAIVRAVLSRGRLM